MEIQTSAEKLSLIMLRRYEKDRVCGLFNFLEKPQRINISVERGIWQKIFDSSSMKWGGPGCSTPESIQSVGSEVDLDMGAHSFVLYRRVKGEK